METRTLDVVLVRTRAAPLSLGLSLVQAVADTASAHGAVVGSIVSTVLVVHWGTLDAVPASSSAREDLVSTLVAEHGSQIAMVSGRAEWPVGTYGGENRLVFGPVSADLDQWLARLCALDLGQHTQMP